MADHLAVLLGFAFILLIFGLTCLIGYGLDRLIDHHRRRNPRGPYRHE